MVEQAVQKEAGFLAERLGTILRNIAAFIFDLFVMIFAMFYFFRDGDRIILGVRSILPFDTEHRDAMMKQARDLISASVTTSLIVAAIQGILGGLGFAIVKLPTPLFWGVAMAFCSLVPVVGSGLIFVPASLWLGFTGHWGRAILLLAICAGVSGVRHASGAHGKHFFPGESRCRISPSGRSAIRAGIVVFDVGRSGQSGRKAGRRNRPFRIRAGYTRLPDGYIALIAASPFWRVARLFPGAYKQFRAKR